MAKQPFEQWLAETAVQLPYPPTPPLKRPRRQPACRLAVAVVLLLLLFGGLLAVPTTRATLFEMLSAGAVRVFLLPPEATPANAETVPTAVSRLGSGRLVSLAEANAALPFAVALPSALPAPDQLYLHDEGITAVTLAWLDPAQPDKPTLILSQVKEEALLGKWAFANQTTTVDVNGQPAYWIEGRHLLQPLRYEQPETAVLVSSNVLVWVDETRSFRLEGDLLLAEALEIANSVR